MVTSIWGRNGARPFVKSLTILLAFAAPTPTVQLSQELCSSLNTGSDSSVVSNHFNSNGACQTACSGFAFAVVQAQNCWCSNYAPADTTSTSDCSEACPGYPYENCGNASSGLFGYVALGKAPSGTIGASTSTSTTSTPTPTSTATPTPSPTPTTSDTVQAVSTQPLPGGPLGTTSSPEATSSSASSIPLVLPTILPTTGPPTATPLAASPLIPHVLTSFSQTSFPPNPSPDPVTVQDTVTESPSVSISFVSITPSTTSTSSTPAFVPVSLNLTPTTSSTPTTLTTSTSSETSSSSSWSATPFTSVTTVTGQIKTLTITPTAPPATATTIITAAKEENGGFFSSSGKVVGTFVAVAILLLLLIAGAIWFFLRRSRRRQAEAAVIPSIAGSSTPQRRPSRLSQMGLVAGGAQREKTGPTIPVIQTSGWGPSNGNGSEKSPADTLSALDRRSSFPRVVDQRLEPTALWNPLHDNGSHVSVRSFRDDQDYSRRMLRIANPDDG